MICCLGSLLHNLFSLILTALKRLFLPSLTSLSYSRYSSLFFILYIFQCDPPVPKHKKTEPTSTFRLVITNSTYLLVPRSTFSPLKCRKPSFDPCNSISFSTPFALPLYISPTVADASPRIYRLPVLAPKILTIIFCRTISHICYSRRNNRGPKIRGTRRRPYWKIQVWFALISSLVCLSLEGRSQEI